ncbi:hypothetical protein GP486_002523 [Trichoglossum hirsutum]|uniref:VWFA domain-containing protein n=1 Tax=Trichoglossum hirsutum TaxID=265104 RepID=A0A9P8LEL7_9PEZI|nr:hypothetical protein GP486_002523 [Trichoglossum hirsutum]
MPAHTTVLVSNICLGATEDDIYDTFESVLKGSKPVVGVGPMVEYTMVDGTERVATTVTIQGHTNVRENLHGLALYPKNPKVSRFAYTEIVVFLFIHGLGGHAFNSWTPGKKSSTMWPRDLLPVSLREKNLNGRFSIVGYKSSWATIKQAAEELLEYLHYGRCAEDRRPMYFALNLALWGGEGVEINDMHRSVFMRGGKCDVKGIVFFGTPFQGSDMASVASHAGGLLGLLGGNSALISSLKSKSEGLATITERFKQVQNIYGINLIIYYESEPFRKRLVPFMTTSAESARGCFAHICNPVALKADHNSMIKFANLRDRNYRQVAEGICNMLKKSRTNDLGEAPEQPALPRDSWMNNLEAASEEPSSQLAIPQSPGTSERNEGCLEAANYDGRDSQIPEEGLLKRYRRRLSTFHKFNPANQSSTNRPQPGASAIQPEHDLSAVKTPIVTYDRTQDTITYVSPSQAIPSTLNAPVTIPAENKFSSLHDCKTVFIIDDSKSMSKPVKKELGSPMSRWNYLIESLRYFGDIPAKSNDDGIDIYFLVNGAKDGKEVRSCQRLLEMLASINTQSSGPSSLDKYAGTGSPTPTPKRLNVIVITDGESDDQEEVEATLVRTARELPILEMPPLRVGIQFLQIGDNEGVKAWLNVLDDKLKYLYGIRDVSI